MYKYQAKLIRVVDGDTVDAEIDLGFNIYIRERIRVEGIDTPETRTRNSFEKSWGHKAKERVIELLDETDGNFILQTKIQKKGKFGRILGQMYTDIFDHKSIGDKLIEERLAIPYEGGNKKAAREKYGVTELWETTIPKEDEEKSYIRGGNGC
jgi:micrococcal nuclease